MSAKDNVIDFEGYKRRRFGLDKPLFSEPTSIKLQDPHNPDKVSAYTIICNIVYQHRQFFALERQDEAERLHTIVEGLTDKGSLVKIVPIKKAEYPEIESLFMKVFEKAERKYNP